MSKSLETELSREAVVSRICGILAKQEGLDAAEMSAASDLRADLNLDSLGLIELQLSLEDVYGSGVLPDEAAERIKTIGDAADTVLAVLNNAASDDV